MLRKSREWRKTQSNTKWYHEELGKSTYLHRRKFPICAQVNLRGVQLYRNRFILIYYTRYFIVCNQHAKAPKYLSQTAFFMACVRCAHQHLFSLFFFPKCGRRCWVAIVAVAFSPRSSYFIYLLFFIIIFFCVRWKLSKSGLRYN